MNEFRLSITSACYVAGLPVEPGAQVSLTPTNAQALLDSGRAELVDPTDAALLAEALIEALVEDFQRIAQATPHVGQSVAAAAQSLGDFERANRPRRGIGFILPPIDD